ncbi:hypothetical protein [Flavobacterium sp. WC2430]|uniref:F0F1 ATP synthase subunit delta n=1 Tax=Flavobacterium sp. WC2430 TaxID=3234137 RepID=UPI003465D533
MKINWFTVIAQIVNFLILVWLLKRYLYKPILTAVEEREKKIVAQLEDTVSEKKEAIKERDEFNQKNQLFDQKKEDLMNNVIAEINETRQKLLEEARNTANALQTKLKKTQEENQENVNLELSQKIEKEVFAIAKKILADLASVSLEKQVVNVFIKHLKELKEEEKKQFRAVFKSGSSYILIKSAFDLTTALQAKIQKSVIEILGSEIQFQYKTIPELISGIELTANGYKLSWSISEYLKSLQRKNSETIAEKLDEINTKKK